ncbi:MAG: hypothetical protein FJX06_04355 [Alphaproteobacteria bacterium]|nr:hypothetical protein [Alphaproteobacteria bacterium]
MNANIAIAMGEKRASRQIEGKRAKAHVMRKRHSATSFMAKRISLKPKSKIATGVPFAPRMALNWCRCDVQKTMCRQPLRERSDPRAQARFILPS